MEVEGYKLKEVLGEGRTGRVYRAVRLADLAEVAFRQVKPHLARDADVVDSVNSLARDCAGFKHVSLVPVLQSFTVQGAICVVEPFIDGQVLSERLKQGLLPAEEVVEIGIQLCEALEELHGRGLAHGDISPNNIVLTGRGARLVGLGVAARTRRRKHNQAMFGDPFDAPEVRDGSMPGAPADLFALSATLHRALLGEQQWGGGPGDEDDPLRTLLNQGMSPSPMMRFPGAAELRRQLIGAQREREKVEHQRVASERRAAAVERQEVADSAPFEVPAWAPKAGIGLAVALVLALGVQGLLSLLPDTPEGMVEVPEGTVSLGDHAGARDERPGLQWSHPRFFIDVREVSVAEYRSCVEVGECTGLGERLPPGWNDRDDVPVVGVTWLQANAWCQWADKRLPSENEWEAAARRWGGVFPWGDDPADCGRAHYGGYAGGACAGEDTARPRSLVPLEGLDAPVGLAGNVWEFTASGYDRKRGPGSGNTAASGSSDLRTIKGGAWSTSAADLRSAGRLGVPMDHWAGDLGFRCVSDPS